MVLKNADANKQANAGKDASKSKKASKKKHISAPIQEIEDDTADMETEQDMVESLEEQEKDFKAAEVEEK